MFLERLKDHILARLEGNSRAGEEGEFTQAQRNSIFLQHGRIFKHSLLRVNYTTYDVRREQDIINPRINKSDILVMSNEDSADAHPFWYAHVLGIFHANIIQAKDGILSLPQRIDFLWVRWLGIDPDHSSGWAAKGLDRVGFVPHEDPEAFGFLDPSCVIRAIHLIPAFAHGRTMTLCPESVARDPEGDWEFFYVNRQAHCFFKVKITRITFL
jgi:hypothetical protein